MPQGNVVELVEGMAGDVGVLIARRPEIVVELLCDGAPEMWNRLDAVLNEESLGEVHRLVDVRHTMEKLGAAARVIYGDTDGKQVTQRWKLHLLNRSRAVTEILAELQASGFENVHVSDQRPVHDAITYLTNQGDRGDHKLFISRFRPGIVAPKWPPGIPSRRR